jgi:nicotinic acid phosphoribosyltransferase
MATHINPIDISDEYFNRVKKMFTGTDIYWKRVRYAVFSRDKGILVGLNKAENFLKSNATDVTIRYNAGDGSPMEPQQICLIYEGYIGELINLETTILGYLSFSGCASRMQQIVDVVEGKPVIDMAARHYPWQIVEELAYAGALAGASGTSTRAGFHYVMKWLGDQTTVKIHPDVQIPFEVRLKKKYGGNLFRLYGTLPHAAAAVLKDIHPDDQMFFPSVRAGTHFIQRFPHIPLVLLIDFEGREEDVIRQAVDVLGDQLAGIRLDTHGARFFQGVEALSSSSEITAITAGMTDIEKKWYGGKGVSVLATRRARTILDELGRSDVQVVVSSGFDEKKTAFFQTHCPDSFDAVGTGSWVSFSSFTADIYEVYIDGRWHPACKEGRIETLRFP